MRLPVRSEADAFAATCVSALVIGVAVVVGLVAGPWWGALAFVALSVAVLAVVLHAGEEDRPHALRDAAHAEHPAARQDAWRILVVADESLAGDELRDAIVRRAKLTPELMIVAPVLVSRTHFVTTDVDHELDDARERLRDSLGWAAAHGLRARGHLGDPMHPLLAVEDELRAFGADEVLVCTHPAQRRGWLEEQMVERIRAELDVPVTQVVVDRAQRRVEIVPAAS